MAQNNRLTKFNRVSHRKSSEKILVCKKCQGAKRALYQPSLTSCMGSTKEFLPAKSTFNLQFLVELITPWLHVKEATLHSAFPLACFQTIFTTVSFPAALLFHWITEILYRKFGNHYSQNYMWICWKQYWNNSWERPLICFSTSRYSNITLVGYS